MKEEWKEIPGENGYYISNFGRVYSKNSGKYMSIRTSSSGGKIFSIRRGGKIKGYFIHRLVAELFVPNPESHHKIIFIDGDKENTRWDNLKWGKSEDYVLPCKNGELISLEAFIERHDLSLNRTAGIVGLSASYLDKYIKREHQFSAATVKRVKALGIDISEPKKVQTEKRVYVRKNTKKKVSRKTFLEDFQLAAVKKFGNTIVSKTHGAEKIIHEFDKFGIKVNVRDFNNRTRINMFGSLANDYFDEKQTHYVVERLD